MAPSQRNGFPACVPRSADNLNRVGKFEGACATSADILPGCGGDEIRRQTFFGEHTKVATETVRIAGAFGRQLEFVFRCLQSISWKMRIQRFVGFVKTALAAGYFSASSLPIPGYCDAVPETQMQRLPIVTPLLSFQLCSAWLAESSARFFPFMRARARPAATRMAFFTALALERPWPMTQTRAPQQRRAAIFRVINCLLQTLKNSCDSIAPTCDISEFSATFQ